MPRQEEKKGEEMSLEKVNRIAILGFDCFGQPIFPKSASKKDIQYSIDCANKEKEKVRNESYRLRRG